MIISHSTFKKNFFLLILVSLFINCESKTNLSDIQIDKKVNEIIDQMTLDEKVGQMTQIDQRFLDTITDLSTYSIG